MLRSDSGRGRFVRRFGLWEERRVALDWQTICLLTHLEQGTCSRLTSDRVLRAVPVISCVKCEAALHVFLF